MTDAATANPDRSKKKPVIVVTAILIGLGIVFALKLPPASALYAFAELTLLLAMFPPLFWWMSKSPKGKRIGGIASAILWCLGILLAFVIKPDSMFIPIPDALLLLGFLPLLFMWRFSFPWIVFGLFNIGVGVLLQTIEYLPNHHFPPELLAPKQHLAEYHKPLSWLIVGLVAWIFGLVRFGKNLAIWLKRRRKKSEIADLT